MLQFGFNQTLGCRSQMYIPVDWNITTILLHVARHKDQKIK